MFGFIGFTRLPCGLIPVSYRFHGFHTPAVKTMLGAQRLIGPPTHAHPATNPPTQSAGLGRDISSAPPTRTSTHRGLGLACTSAASHTDPRLHTQSSGAGPDICSDALSDHMPWRDHSQFQVWPGHSRRPNHSQTITHKSRFVLDIGSAPTQTYPSTHKICPGGASYGGPRCLELQHQDAPFFCLARQVEEA